jgi:hypothetical protein
MPAVHNYFLVVLPYKINQEKEVEEQISDRDEII